MSEGKLAVIRIRGQIGIKTGIRDTLKMLNLLRSNCCVIIPNNDTYRGMVKKVKDYVTYGEIDEETHKLLVEKRGDEKSKFFRLNPPRKGFGRKGIKITFKGGGALGNREAKINDLIKRMI